MDWTAVSEMYYCQIMEGTHLVVKM